MNAETRRFTRVSGRAEAILGYPIERWRSVPGFWIGVLHPDDRERVAQAVWRALRDRSPCEIEYRAVAADGSVVRLRDRVKVIPDPDGRGLVLQGAMTDLTSRARAGAAGPPWAPRRWRRGRYTAPLVVPAPPAPSAPVVGMPSGPPAQAPATPAEDAEPWRPVPRVRAPGPAEPAAAPATHAPFEPERLLARLGEAVVASDADHRIVYWNPAAEALLGIPASEAVGRADGDLLRTRTSAGQTAEILAGLLGRRPWSAEVTIADAADNEIPVRITASALRNHEHVAGYVAVITDLREVRRGEAVRGAAAVMDAVARLARGVATELNESVNRIEAAVRVALARVEPGASARAGLDDALRTVDATAALASQLLAVGRATPATPRPTDLREMVIGAMSSIQLLAGDTIELITELDPATPHALADPAAVSQILLNLAADSVNAMSDGGRIIIRTGKAALGRDVGPGLPASAAPGEWVVLELQRGRQRVRRN